MNVALNTSVMNPAMIEMMDLVVELDLDGIRLTRKVIAGKSVGKGKTLLLVDTEIEGKEKTRQWVCANFFKSWVHKVSHLGINSGHPERQDTSW